MSWGGKYFLPQYLHATLALRVNAEYSLWTMAYVVSTTSYLVSSLVSVERLAPW